MRDDYQLTELGEIPMHWKIMRLKDIGSFKNGINKSKEDFGHGFPFINLMDVFGRNIVRPQNLSLVNASQKELKDYDLLRGDVLFIRSSVKPSGVGLSALILDDIPDTVYSGFLIRFRDNGTLLPNYKRYCFYEAGFRNRLLNLSSVSANANINQDSLASLFINIPPHSEQNLIASVLDTVEEKIEIIESKIKQTRELKKGLMQKLLTKGVGHTKFKDSIFGEIPESWAVVKLSEVLKLQGGFAFKSKDDCEQGIRWLKIANVAINKIKWDDKSFLPFGFDLLFPDFLLKKDDILIAMTRPILGGSLKIARVTNKDEGSLLNQRVGRILTNDKITNDFIYHVLNSVSLIMALNKELLGTDPPNISSTMFEALFISLPPLPEQEKISIILNSVNEKLEILDIKKDAFIDLKNGLMQQLLTGKIRTI